MNDPVRTEAFRICVDKLEQDIMKPPIKLIGNRVLISPVEEETVSGFLIPEEYRSFRGNFNWDASLLEAERKCPQSNSPLFWHYRSRFLHVELCRPPVG